MDLSTNKKENQKKRQRDSYRSQGPFPASGAVTLSEEVFGSLSCRRYEPVLDLDAWIPGGEISQSRKLEVELRYLSARLP